MKKLFTFLLLISFTTIIVAGEIDKSTAKKVAVNFFYERIQQLESSDYAKINADEIFTISTNGETALYAVNISGGGYVLVAAYDNVRPVAGYSLRGKYTELDQPPQFADLLEQYKHQIADANALQIAASSEVKQMWDRLLTDDPSQLKPLLLEKSVEPLITTTWDQGTYYNEMCPADPAGPGGHCYTGCVATTLGQVVNYFRWPETGLGSYTYSCPPYGDLTADFGNTTYEWDKMATELNESNQAVALMLNHQGIGCDMVYGPNGSGMYNHKAAYVLRTYFKYSPETIYVYRDSTTMDWDSLLITHLDKDIPMYYAGWSVPNINGHAFVCDGYQADFYYHFNWGWSGSFDGYFYTDALNPGGSNFNLAQELVINAVPDTNLYAYPYYCDGDKLLDGASGTIDDGSGPIYDYKEGADCSWLIAPVDSVENITIEFLRFNTAIGDVLSVYDGENTSAPLLGTFEGQGIPAEITSSGDKVLITFTSDGSGNAPGWLLSYTSKIPVYCIGMSNLNEQSGFLSDGSGPRDYHNSSTCLWMIDPPGASELTIYFTSFNTEEVNDLVKVYDLDNNLLLAEFSGDITPGPVTSPSGRMFLTFATNYTITAPGWEAWYETDLVKVEENTIDQSLQIYPNPADENIKLSYLSETTGITDISIASMSGRLVHTQSYNSIAGSNMLDINVSHLEAGIYLLTLRQEEKMVYRKLVIE